MYIREIEPSYDFVHGVLQMSAQFAKAPNFGDLPTPHRRHDEVFVEAREFVHQLKFQSPVGATSIDKPVK
jgi:hypothetical protein